MPTPPARPTDCRITLVLQGGGALGAYQAGVCQALEEAGFAPDWVAGTSIGAIIGAIIAGNAPERRVSRLREFWRRVSRPDPVDPALLPEQARQLYGAWSWLSAAWSGQPGFFTPRPFPPLTPTGTAQTASWYDTHPLHELLTELVDFERLNRQGVRFSLGAVHLRTGKLRYFDSLFQTIRVEHVMASGALPPGFPAVEVDGELWWDGGIYSNTPIEVVLDDYPRRDTLCFMIDLFSASGPEPRSIPEVMVRQKDIEFASRSRQHIENYARIHNLRRAVRALHRRMGESERADPAVHAAAGLGCHTTMRIVHFTSPAGAWELATRDADFSRATLETRQASGYRDGLRAIAAAPWEAPLPPDQGVAVYEVVAEPGA